MVILLNDEFLRGAEAVLLDCDGTIIDATKSYDLAVKLSTVIVIDRLTGLQVKIGKEDVDRTLGALRMSGGFNNDTDSASAIIQSIVAFSPASAGLVGGEWTGIEDAEVYEGLVDVEVSHPPFVSAALKWLFSELSTRRAYFDLRGVEELIDSKASELGSVKKTRDLRSILGYPGAFGESLLATLFDEIFLGSEGVREKYGWEPKYAVYRGTLENERLLISAESMKRLAEAYPNRVALVTGRGRWETEKTIRPILSYINMDASLFTADLGPDYEKPSPKALEEASKILGVSRVIYVGNSMEDLLMSRAALRNGLEVGFVGVAYDDEMVEEFSRRGADAILRDINDLPSLVDSLRG